MITNYNEIIIKIDQINPIKYARDRNFTDGSVSNLSPYISRGVISTKFVYDFLLKKGYTLLKIQKFVQELVWREFWQMIWLNNNINKDFRFKQKNIKEKGLPKDIFLNNTKIKVIDQAIIKLYKKGYMHNHLRMYISSIITNIGGYHWKIPAQWMYYHLLDADWGSNALSWQWICGTFNNRKYYANQDNINRFTKRVDKAVRKAKDRLSKEHNITLAQIDAIIERKIDREVDDAANEAIDRAVSESVTAAIEESVGAAMARGLVEAIEAATGEAIDQALETELGAAIDAEIARAVEMGIDEAAVTAGWQAYFDTLAAGGSEAQAVAAAYDACGGPCEGY